MHGLALTAAACVGLQGIRVCSMLEGGLTPVHTFDSCRDMGFNLVLRPVTGGPIPCRAGHGSNRSSPSHLLASQLMRSTAAPVACVCMSCLDGRQQLHSACEAARSAASSPAFTAQSACECLYPAVRLPLTAT